MELLRVIEKYQDRLCGKFVVTKFERVKQVPQYFKTSCLRNAWPKYQLYIDTDTLMNAPAKSKFSLVSPAAD